MVVCGGAVTKQIVIDPDDAVANAQVGREPAERELVHNHRGTLRPGFRPCGGRK